MQKQRIIKLNDAKPLLKEADILLFQAGGFLSAGWWISIYGKGLYSHVGLVHFDNNVPFCVEQREFRGGRSVSLEGQVKKFPKKIDVFRVAQEIYVEKFADAEYIIYGERKRFTNEVAHQITSEALGLTGQPYSWKTILAIGKSYLPICRLWDNNLDDDYPINSFVCSTLAQYCYRKYYVDLINYLPDSKTRPNDIARSPLTNYLFTLAI